MRKGSTSFVLSMLTAVLVLSAAMPLPADARSNNARDTRQTLQRYARDTWASFVAMTDPNTGLPADSLKADGTRSVQTSTTNIGAYMWSTLVAEQLDLIRHEEAIERVNQ